MLAGPLQTRAVTERQHKVQVSRKLLQAYLNTTPRGRPETPPNQLPRTLSYSKLLQETPDAFRLQRKYRNNSRTRLIKEMKLPGALSGVQGVKSTLTGKASKQRFRLTSKCEKASCTSMNDDGWDPDVIDISPEGYLASGQVVPLPRIHASG